jgi:hypothetical protein
LSRKAWQVAIVAIWAVFVIAYVWAFHIDPPHDDEYGKWLFFSLLHTALPWTLCFVPLVLVVLSLEAHGRPRRTWIATVWTLTVICLAWIQLRPAFFPGPRAELGMGQVSALEWRTTNVEIFAVNRLLPALLVLAALLWIEKKLISRGLLT